MPRPGFDPARDVVLDPRTLRGLAHPLRVRLLGELREGGPATATQLASRVAESSGATSYHLRQLAAYGFVVEVEGRGTARERWWRAAHRSTWFDPDLTDVGDRQAGADYLRAVAHRYAERLLRFVDALPDAPDALGADWADAAEISDWLLDLTIDEAHDLRTRFHELCLPYRREEGDQPRSGARRVVVQFQLLPTDVRDGT